MDVQVVGKLYSRVEKNTVGMKTADSASPVTEEKTTAAYSLEISAGVSDGTDDAAQKTKGLTADQVGVLKDGIAASQALMIKVMTANNEKLQGYLSALTGKLNFGGVLIDTSRFALPEAATTPEEAQKAISDGGAYSVQAVADRVFGMAAEIADGDPEKLEAMRAAVEKGFAQAGLEFNEATGASGLPQICQDTHEEIMNRFDKLKAQLAGTDTVADSAGATV